MLTRALFVSFLLLTPLLEEMVIRGQDRYRIGSETVEKLGYMGEVTYAQKPPIDMLFVGPSGIMSTIVTRDISQELSISAINFGHFETGSDGDYFLVKNLLENRGVKILFIGLSPLETEIPHRISRALWRPLEESDLPLEIFGSHYADKLLYSLPAIVKSRYFKVDEKAIFDLEWVNGVHLAHRAFSEDRETMNEKDPMPQVELRPLKLHLKDILLERNGPEIYHMGVYDERQDYFFQRLVDLARERGVKVYFLHYPTIRVGIIDKIPVYKFLIDPAPEIPYLGVVPTRLFGTDSREKMKAYFYNDLHTNVNGSVLFTASILPALKEIYEMSNQ